MAWMLRSAYNGRKVGRQLGTVCRLSCPPPHFLVPWGHGAARRFTIRPAHSLRTKAVDRRRILKEKAAKEKVVRYRTKSQPWALCSGRCEHALQLGREPSAFPVPSSTTAGEDQPITIRRSHLRTYARGISPPSPACKIIYLLIVFQEAAEAGLGANRPLTEEEEAEEPVQLALVGRPNVGERIAMPVNGTGKYGSSGRLGVVAPPLPAFSLNSSRSSHRILTAISVVESILRSGFGDVGSEAESFEPTLAGEFLRISVFLFGFSFVRSSLRVRRWD